MCPCLTGRRLSLSFLIIRAASFFYSFSVLSRKMWAWVLVWNLRKLVRLRESSPWRIRSTRVILGSLLRSSPSSPQLYFHGLTSSRLTVTTVWQTTCWTAALRPPAVLELKWMSPVNQRGITPLHVCPADSIEGLLRKQTALPPSYIRESEARGRVLSRGGVWKPESSWNRGWTRRIIQPSCNQGIHSEVGSS